MDQGLFHYPEIPDTALSPCWWWVVLGDFVEIKHRRGFSATCGTKTTSRAFSASTVHSLNSPSLRVTSGLGSPTSACVGQAYSSLRAFVSTLPSTWGGFPFPQSGIPHTYTFIRSFIDSRMLTQCLLGARLREPYLEHRKSVVVSIFLSLLLSRLPNPHK